MGTISEEHIYSTFLLDTGCSSHCLMLKHHAEALGLSYTEQDGTVKGIAKPQLVGQFAFGRRPEESSSTR
jgi:hypothetical protein